MSWPIASRPGPRPDTANPERDLVVACLARQPALIGWLAALRALDLADAWIGGGAVRNAVWDALHGYPASAPIDIDVAYFDAGAVDPAHDRALERRLAGLVPAAPWSVRNQARMHCRNGHAPYRSTADAIGHWVETATAVAVRLDPAGRLELLAPHGLVDLAGLVLRPVPAYRDRISVFRQRQQDKGWLRRWPRLHVDEGPASR